MSLGSEPLGSAPHGGEGGASGPPIGMSQPDIGIGLVSALNSSNIALIDGDPDVGVGEIT